MEPSSSSEDVMPPVTLVELQDLKTMAGNPFRVYVERLPEEVLVDIMRTLPGDMPTPIPRQDSDSEVAERENQVRKWLGWAPALIERASFLRRLDGHETRPAFYFGEKMPGALKGSYLTARDRTSLMNAILQLSGWTKEAAAPASFHVGDGGGSSGGAGTVDAGEGGGPDSMGGPP